MYLVTGSAGFIGFHTCLRLLQNNFNVLGIDNLNNYYDVKLKKKRNEVLSKYKNFSFIKADILDKNRIKELFSKYKFKIVIHLAAQAGVRYSIQFPEKYIDVNIGNTNSYKILTNLAYDILVILIKKYCL
jgi:UDP-glucuronate 4-epimerase